MKPYVVKKNEDLASIVHRECRGTSLADVCTLPENESLFSTRSQHILNPGDQLWLPEAVAERVFTVETGKRHTFVVKRQVRHLRLTLKRQNGSRIANAEYTLDVDGQTITGTTDANGLLAEKVPMSAEKGRLSICGKSIELELAGLDPIETPTGIQERLTNLGYSVGPIDGIVGPKTKAAVRAFQDHYGLATDGIAGPVTQSKLVDAHGC